MDPATKQIYYYHTVTGKTQWDRPAEMGAAPKNTGWYGRGKAGVSTKINENNEKYLKRPAIKQAEATGGASTAYREGADEFNIWYGRYQQNYSGGATERPLRHAAKSRFTQVTH